MSAISVSWLNVSWGAVHFETNYGLMQHSYIEIINKLLRALDSEYNVVDMATVFEVVAVLEKTPITPEILETTRLGRVINECRRRTSNEALAKRAKHLLRHWRDMMIAPNAEKSNSTVVSPSASAPPLIAPSVPQQNGTNVRSSHALKADRVAASSLSPALSIASSGGRNSNSVYDSKVSPSSSLSPGGDPKVESVPKTHVANKRLRKNAASPVAGEPPIKVSKINGAMFAEQRAAAVGEMSEDSVDYDFSRLREPLPPQPSPVTEDDSASSAAAASGQTVVTESVPEPDPPLPKKRSRKKGNKRKPQADDIIKEKLVALSKTVRVKTTEELVAELKSRTEDRLSATTTTASTSDARGGECHAVKPSLSNHVLPADAAADGRGESSSRPPDEKLDPETRVEREIAAILSKLPPIDPDEIVWDSTPEPSAPSTPRPPTEEDVDRYLQQQWSDVNGCVTHGVVSNDENAFREWHEMVARRTTNDDLIHILPYSIVD